MYNNNNNNNNILPVVSNLLMSRWKEEEEENGTNTKQERMLRDQLKSQGRIYLPEDLQYVRKEDGALNP